MRNIFLSSTVSEGEAKPHSSSDPYSVSRVTAKRSNEPGHQPPAPGVMTCDACGGTATAAAARSDAFSCAACGFLSPDAELRGALGLGRSTFDSFSPPSDVYFGNVQIELLRSLYRAGRSAVGRAHRAPIASNAADGEAQLLAWLSMRLPPGSEAEAEAARMWEAARLVEAAKTAQQPGAPVPAAMSAAAAAAARGPDNKSESPVPEQPLQQPHSSPLAVTPAARAVGTGSQQLTGSSCRCALLSPRARPPSPLAHQEATPVAAALRPAPPRQPPAPAAAIRPWMLMRRRPPPPPPPPLPPLPLPPLRPPPPLPPPPLPPAAPRTPRASRRAGGRLAAAGAAARAPRAPRPPPGWEARRARPRRRRRASAASSPRRQTRWD